MTTALKEKVVIKPGGIIEICSPELPEGATADVIVLLEEPQLQPVKLMDMLGAAKGGFATPEEVDKFIRAERDTWES